MTDYADSYASSEYADAAIHAAMSAAEEQKHLVAYAPLVKRIARQLTSQVSGAMGREDMEQIGLMGLLEALRRYGTPDTGFSSYASLRVRGAILDELRRQDWRPRAVRQDSHKMRDAVRALTRKLGREPNDKEAADALGIGQEEWRQFLLDDCAEELLSFDDMLQEATERAHSAPGPEEQFMVRRSLEQALGALNEREQRVVQMIYEFELSYKEIAAVLDLSDARVCQLNKSALAKMKAALAQA
ncbi:FliA/WhiG family RNA polymerase sigma factor [Massilia sp. Root335]|jgi:RNA polymerase sigma factor for flagellar operon FliA|uniref:FliA/WhiG family RNA polymerase sigma factor n=1 Tax=Massilia sp. Root335 TaxID=1736517 RepID=UPI0006F4FABE|nr:FliA/WhiG family RNA polymerase sigma factor [Massilia sp. Root335]KQV49995.1 flagellar biosynthesis sigma factor [Massilia sp. Root335]